MSGSVRVFQGRLQPPRHQTSPGRRRRRPGWSFATSPRSTYSESLTGPLDLLLSNGQAATSGNKSIFEWFCAKVDGPAAGQDLTGPPRGTGQEAQMAHITSGGRVGWFGWRSALGAILLGAVAACGGGGGGGGPPPGSGALTATIDGQAFASDASAATATVAASAPGAYALSGSKVISSTNFTRISLTLYN